MKSNQMKLKLLLLSLLTAFVVNSQTTLNTVSGMLKSESTQSVIYGAKIKIKESNEETYSDTEGRFTISTITPYPFTLLITAQSTWYSNFTVPVVRSLE
jgi:hypothetical protein